MHGPNTLMSEVMGLFFSMNKLVGSKLDEGLASLKRTTDKALVVEG